MSERSYEVEVTLTVNASNHDEAKAAVERSGITVGALIGETLIDHVYVWRQNDEL